ncbi:MAG: 50S ribosomal protein L13 [Acidobacteria bacterium]|nr:50S ribosomal protein L13 [Acidobacteriota bacterium]
MRTYFPRGKDVEALAQEKWYVVDARDQVLGRLAARVARLLIGKHKPRWSPHLDCGDHVVVINARQVQLTGKKLEQKVYRWHSGYPGGLKEFPAKALYQKKPEMMVREAILGMLPKNKLHKRRAKKLRVYANGEHPHQAQQPELIDVGKEATTRERKK